MQGANGGRGRRPLEGTLMCIASCLSLHAGTLKFRRRGAAEDRYNLVFTRIRCLRICGASSGGEKVKALWASFLSWMLLRVPPCSLTLRKRKETWRSLTVCIIFFNFTKLFLRMINYPRGACSMVSSRRYCRRPLPWHVASRNLPENTMHQAQIRTASRQRLALPLLMEMYR